MHKLRFSLIAVFGFLAILAHAGESTPTGSPPAPPRDGETLTERLDRTDSVIKPPPVDAPMHVEPPPVNSDMPVIKPKDAPVQQSAPAPLK